MNGAAVREILRNRPARVDRDGSVLRIGGHAAAPHLSHWSERRLAEREEDNEDHVQADGLHAYQMKQLVGEDVYRENHALPERGSTRAGAGRRAGSKRKAPEFLAPYGKSGDGHGTSAAAPTAEELAVVAVKSTKDDILPNHGHEYVARHPFRVLLSGVSGTGKTTLTLNLLNKFYCPYFDECILFSSTYGEDSMWWELNRTPDKIFLSWDEKAFVQLMQGEDGGPNKRKKRPLTDGKGNLNPLVTKEDFNPTGVGPKRLVVFDDMMMETGLMNSKDFGTFTTLCRHYNLSVVFCTQKYNFASKLIRTQMQAWFLFPTINSAEIDDMCDELSSGNRNGFRALMRHVEEKPYQFLSVFNLPVIRSKRYRVNLDRIVDIDSFGTANTRSTTKKRKYTKQGDE